MYKRQLLQDPIVKEAKRKDYLEKSKRFKKMDQEGDLSFKDFTKQLRERQGSVLRAEILKDVYKRQLMSGALVRQTDGEASALFFRPLGAVETKEPGHPLEVYELSASWDEIQHRLKKETEELFSLGILQLRTGLIKESRECFARILRRNGGDMAARRYFDVCDGILTGERNLSLIHIYI